MTEHGTWQLWTSLYITEHCVEERTLKMPCPATKVSDTWGQVISPVRKTGPQYNVSLLVPCPGLRTSTPLSPFKILKAQTVCSTEM